MLTKKFFLLSKEFFALKTNLKGVFQSIKDELDEHLDSINQSTNEIQSNYEYIAEIDSKLEKLSDRLDELQMKIDPQFRSYDFSNIRLSKREQEIFLNLYTVEDRIAVSELARNCGLDAALCESVLGGLSAKGIPILRQRVDDVFHVSLEYNFKDLQARKNLLNIDTSALRVVH